MDLDDIDVNDLSEEILKCLLEEKGTQFNEDDDIDTLRSLLKEENTESRENSSDIDREPVRTNVESFCENERDVADMGYVELIDELSRQNVCFEEMENIEDLRHFVLKRRLDKKRDNSDYLKSLQMESTIWEIDFTNYDDADILRRKLDQEQEPEKPSAELWTENIKVYEKQKRELAPIYGEIISMSEIKGEIETETRKAHNDYERKFQSMKKDLEEEEFEIVITGEVSAGKSSVMNLLIGEDVFPVALLDSTATICRLKNYHKKEAIVYEKDKDNRIVSLAKNGLEELNSLIIQRNFRGENPYEMIDIYWPLPLLKGTVSIVDTPGIGENMSSRKRLLEYIPRAVAYIFVINSAKAGGIQKDRLQRIFEQIHENAETASDPKRMLFICNKWDQVPADERNDLLDVTKDKLKQIFPSVSDDSVFTSCTLQERQRVTNGLPHSKSFRHFRKRLTDLVSGGLTAKIQKHQRFLMDFLSGLQRRSLQHLRLFTEDAERKEKIRREGKQGLKDLKSLNEKGYKDLLQHLDRAIGDIAKLLYEHLNSESTKACLFNWSEKPEWEKYMFDPDVLQAQLLEIFKNRILRELRNRLQNEDILDIQKECEVFFKSRLSDIYAEIKKTDQTFSATEEEEDNEEDESDSEVLSTGTKVALGITSPIWIPLVTVFAVIAIPFAIGVAVKNQVKVNRILKDPETFLNPLAKQTLEGFSVTQLKSIIYKNTEFGQYKIKLEEFFEENIPRKIEALEEVLQNATLANITYEAVHDLHGPLIKRARELTGKIILSVEENHELFIKCQISPVQTKYKGRFSTISTGALIRHGHEKGEKGVTIKTLQFGVEKLKPALHILDRIRRLKPHDNIAKFYGLSVTDECVKVVTELVDEPLVEVLKRMQENDPEGFQLENLEENFKEKQLLSWAFHVASGLRYLHSKDIVHQELKLSNVVVKSKSNVAMLTDIGLYVEMEHGNERNITYHMAPEMINHLFYDTSADIFSFGYFLWEMWYERQAFDKANTIDYIKSSTKYRPSFKGREIPEKLQQLIERCWCTESRERPSASFIMDKIFKMIHS